jgi:hypothetical protein
MAEERTIEMAIDAVTLTQISNITGNEKLFHALGYLSQWNMSLPKVRINACMYESYGNPEIVATYWREDGSIGYQIGAVWHDDHFGFHS